MRLGEPWHVDADHIQLATRRTVSAAAAIFFTIDVADSIGHSARTAKLIVLLILTVKLIGTLELPGLSTPFAVVTGDDVRRVAMAIPARGSNRAARFTGHIESVKGEGNLIAEVPWNETDFAANAARRC